MVLIIPTLTYHTTLAHPINSRQAKPIAATQLCAMAKAKSTKGTTSIPNKVQHSRVSYLYQAAAYLAAQSQSGALHTQGKKDPSPDNLKSEEDIGTAQKDVDFAQEAPFHPEARRLVSDIRSVTLKAQMRISPAMKHGICKNCDSLLMDGSTSTVEVENKSKGGKKPWSDVLVRRCNTCGMEKRFPLAERRQKRRPLRQLQDATERGDIQND